MKNTGLTMNAMRLILLTSMATGCATVNTNPSVLSTEPYNQVTYASSGEKELQKMDSIEITTRGEQANILNSVPALFKKAIEANATHISNIHVSTSAKHEPYQVSYDDCKYVTEGGYKNVCKTVYESRSENVCTGYGSSRRCSYQTRSVPRQKCENKYVTEQKRKCTKKYRTEKRWVLYQKATADLYKGGPKELP